MLPPNIFGFSPVPTWYGLSLAVAFILCLELGYRRARKYGLAQELLSAVAFWGLLSGLAGARAGYILSHPHEFAWSRPLEWIAIWHGGQTFYGGLAGGLIAAVVVARLHHTHPWRILDFMAALMPLGHAVGRVGCFLRGCCFGKVSDLPWAIRFPRHLDVHGQIIGSDVYIDHLATGKIGPDAQWSLPVHPTQLYSIVALLVISAILWRVYDKRSFDGQVSAIYLVAYGIWRFAVEFIRVEPKELLGLTAWQWISLGLLTAGIVVYAYQRNRAPAQTRQTATERTMKS